VEALGAIESDLIDAYICGTCRRTTAEVYGEFHEFSKEGERVEFARTLMNSAVREQAGAGRIEGRKEEKWRAGRLQHALVPARSNKISCLRWLSDGQYDRAVAVQNGRLRNELQRMKYAQTELQHQVDIARQQAANRGTRYSWGEAGNTTFAVAVHEIRPSPSCCAWCSEKTAKSESQAAADWRAVLHRTAIGLTRTSMPGICCC